MQARLSPDGIDRLIRSLAGRGYEVVGPTVRDGAVIYDQIEGAGDLPRGWTDEQEAGRYRLQPRPDGALFGYTVGPQSWKKYLHPAHVKLFEAEKHGGVFRILDGAGPAERPYAFVGVRACEWAAIGVLDRVLLNNKFRDRVYGGRRDGVFVVAVQCTQAAATCFCASMGTGPEVHGAADLVLTEVVSDKEHWFLAEAGSERGREVLAELDRQPVTEEAVRQAGAAVKAAGEQQVRRMETEGLRDVLVQNFEHLQWDKVAARCLTCANCTMVCPTCFCTTVEDGGDITGDHAGRWRRWDSCFTMSFSFIHGGSVRTSSKARYRQWLTHKLASWIDQFGTSGCVGCGRCITWCPAGIDLTEEVQSIRGAVNHGNTDA
jgi:Fe-S-cluster-containing hydrogenase component 2